MVLYLLKDGRSEKLSAVTYEALTQWMMNIYRQNSSSSSSFSLQNYALASASGRIDIMGGFADYSGAHVLQYPIGQRTYALVFPTTSQKIEAASAFVSSVNDLLSPENAHSIPLESVWRREFPLSVLRNETDGGLCDENELLKNLSSLKGTSSSTSSSSSSSSSCSSSSSSCSSSSSSLQPGEASSWHLFVLGVVQAILAQRRTSSSFSSSALEGLAIVLVSDVPTSCGLASSASVEMAMALALAHLFLTDDDCTKKNESHEEEVSGGTKGLLLPSPTSLALLCHRVENRVVGAASGFMDQVCLAHAEQNCAASFRCVLPLHEPVAQLAVPPSLAIYAITSGVKHSVAGAHYEKVRTATAMGKIILSTLLPHSSSSLASFSLKHLCDLPLAEFESSYRDLLPESLTGEDFLANYGHLPWTDVTTIKPDWNYSIRAASSHPIEENARSLALIERLTQLREGNIKEDASILAEIGSLFKASHDSYSACGMGSRETDLVVRLVYEQSVSTTTPMAPLVGARITGGGNGGTVVVLGRKSEAAEEAIQRIARQYEESTGLQTIVLRGSSSKMQLHCHKHN